MEINIDITIVTYHCQFSVRIRRSTVIIFNASPRRTIGIGINIAIGSSMRKSNSIILDIPRMHKIGPTACKKLENP